MFFKLSLILLLLLCYCAGMVGNPFIMCLMVVTIIGSSCLILSFFCPLWIAYSLIIVFLGGMMVMFSYVSSMSSGDKVWSKGSMKSSVLLLSSVAVFSALPMKSEFNLSLMYLQNNMMVLVLCTFYLLFCLFLVVKMVEVKKGCLVN